MLPIFMLWMFWQSWVVSCHCSYIDCQCVHVCASIQDASLALIVTRALTVSLACV